jgi:hypothetical protein
MCLAAPVYAVPVAIETAGMPSYAEASAGKQGEPCTCQIGSSFPTPPSNERSLFYIQRSPNVNTIMYEVNEDGGQVEPEHPVKVYWIRYGEEGQREDLSYIQRNYAYGIKSKKLDARNYELRFVSYKKLPFLMSLSDKDNRYHVYAKINNVDIEVSRVFLQIEGGTFWFPNVVCAEVRGLDRTTGKPVVQNFKP